MNKEHGSAKGQALDFCFSFTFYTVSQKFWNWGCSLQSSLQKLKSLESKVKSHHHETYEGTIVRSWAGSRIADSNLSDFIESIMCEVVFM